MSNVGDIDAPMVMVRATFLSAEEGGRESLPAFGPDPWYKPHIVIQSPQVRKAAHDTNGMGCEDYLGVIFVDGPQDYQVGQEAEFLVKLMYWPEVDYSAVVSEATFTIREGGTIVGFGTILSRANE